MASAKAQLGIGSLLFDMLDGGDKLQRDVIQEASVVATRRWFHEILPQHFEPSAPRRYPQAYVNRTKKYQIDKARKKHHQKPMVWSGAFERSQKSGYSATARVSRATVRQVIRLPQARIVNIWKRGRKHDFTESISAFNAQDFEDIRIIMETEIAAGLIAELRKQGQVESTFTASS